jgi:hypothetical protein
MTLKREIEHVSTRKQKRVEPLSTPRTHKKNDFSLIDLLVLLMKNAPSCEPRFLVEPFLRCPSCISRPHSDGFNVFPMNWQISGWSACALGTTKGLPHKRLS